MENFIEKKVNNKIVKIPKKIIAQYCKMLQLTQDQAIQTFLEEEGYLENEEIEKMTQQAKQNGTAKHYEKADRIKKTRAKKEVQNPDKEYIIQEIAQFLSKNEEISNIFIANHTKLVEFVYKNKQFKLDLIEKRVKK